MDLPSMPPSPSPSPGRGPESGTRFCPRCGHVDGLGSILCRHCGETLSPQGYCTVCEAFWALAPGSQCPKHDLVLDARAPGRDEALVTSGDQAWVTVENFSDSLRAEAPRIRLESEGIPTFVEGERMGSPSMYRVATGGVKLQVPQSLAGEARILLAQSWSPVEEDDLDDAWDDLGPDPSAIWRDLGHAVILVVLLAPLLLYLLSLWLNAR